MSSRELEMAKARAARAPLSSVGIEEENKVLREAGFDGSEMVDTVSTEPMAVPTEVKTEESPMDALSKMPGGPPRKLMEQWKANYPEVLVLPLDDKNVYIYRYLTHIEWHKQIKTQEALLKDQEAMKDSVVKRCLLWPQMDPVSMNMERAGLRDLLFDVIMQSSYFIDTNVALSLVSRL